MKFKSVILLASLLAAPVFGQSALAANFVTDQLEITLRTGPGVDYRIASMLRAGTRLEVIEKRKGWSHVKVSGDREGWIITRFITTDAPKGPQLVRAQKKLGDANAKISTLTSQLAETQKSLSTALKEAEATAGKLDSVDKEFVKWKKVNEGVISLTSDHEGLKTQSIKDAEALSSLTMENRQLKARKNVYWFISGAIILLVGLGLGYLYIKSKQSYQSGGYRF